MAKTPVNPNEISIREAARLYATEYANKGKGYAKPAAINAFINETISFFPDDQVDAPGSAIQLFMPDEATELTPLAKIFGETAPEDGTVKKAMMNLRYIGDQVLKGNMSLKDNRLTFLPDSKPNTSLNNKIFGRSEPKKAEASIAINPSKEAQRSFFAQLAAKTENPETRKQALGAIFLQMTGLRSEVLENLARHHYDADSATLFIPGSVTGTKGNPVNIPLNPIADSIIQEFIREREGKYGNYKFTGSGAGKDGGELLFFSEGSKDGTLKKLSSQSVTDVMRDIRVKKLLYDWKRDLYFNSLSAEGLAGQTKSGSRLLRNFHATIGQALGIPQDRIAYLQGRSTKSMRVNASTGSLEVYQIAFPNVVSDIDRNFSTMYASFYKDMADVSGLDFSKIVDLETPRITADTQGFEGYFDQPAATVSPVVSGDAIDGISLESRNQLKADGFDDFFDLTEPTPVPEPEPDPPKKKRRRSRKEVKKAAVAAGTAAATLAAKSAKAAGMLIPGPDPLELVAGVLDEQMSPEGQSAADIAVERGQKFAGDLLGVEPRRAESMSDIFTKETLAQTAGGIGGVLADALTLGTVSGTGPFSGERTGNISGRNLRAQQLRERQQANEGFIPKP